MIEGSFVADRFPTISYVIRTKKGHMRYGKPHMVNHRANGVANAMADHRAILRRKAHGKR